MAGNPLLINLENLQAQGLLNEDDLSMDHGFSDSTVDYQGAYAFKLSRLRRASEKFKEIANGEDRSAFDQFRKDCRSWLEDYGLFMALKDNNGGLPWTRWDKSIARRDPFTLNQARVDLAAEIFFS